MISSQGTRGYTHVPGGPIIYLDVSMGPEYRMYAMRYWNEWAEKFTVPGDDYVEQPSLYDGPKPDPWQSLRAYLCYVDGLDRPDSA